MDIPELTNEEREYLILDVSFQQFVENYVKVPFRFYKMFEHEFDYFHEKSPYLSRSEELLMNNDEQIKYFYDHVQKKTAGFWYEAQPFLHKLIDVMRKNTHYTFDHDRDYVCNRGFREEYRAKFKYLFEETAETFSDGSYTLK